MKVDPQTPQSEQPEQQASPTSTWKGRVVTQIFGKRLSCALSAIGSALTFPFRALYRSIQKRISPKPFRAITFESKPKPPQTPNKEYNKFRIECLVKAFKKSENAEGWAKDILSDLKPTGELTRYMTRLLQAGEHIKTVYNIVKDKVPRSGGQHDSDQLVLIENLGIFLENYPNDVNLVKEVSALFRQAHLLSEFLCELNAFEDDGKRAQAFDDLPENQTEVMLVENMREMRRERVGDQ